MKLKAFTMAEAILTMTILGIIATIMISTLKPAEYREKGLQILAKKVMGEIDDATTQILINNSRYGKMNALHRAGGTTTFNMGDYDSRTTNAEYLAELYKGYLASTRTACNTTNNCPCVGFSNFWLKDGACVRVAGAGTSDYNTWFPGETTSISVTLPYGYIFFDINGADDPNILGQDQFKMPFNLHGIAYDGTTE